MKKLRITIEDFIKANKIGSRNAELEFATGWVAKHKIHNSEKNYNRKEKHKKEIDA